MGRRKQIGSSKAIESTDVQLMILRQNLEQLKRLWLAAFLVGLVFAAIGLWNALT